MEILWNQGNGRIEGQTIRKEAAKDGGRNYETIYGFTTLRQKALKARPKGLEGWRKNNIKSKQIISPRMLPQKHQRNVSTGVLYG